MEKQISFKSRARLMPQIGDQLIKNESIALLGKRQINTVYKNISSLG